MRAVSPATLITDRLSASIVPQRGDNGGYSLVIDGVTQSHVNPDDPGDLQLDYVRAIAATVDVAFPPAAPVSALHLGGGALTVARYVGATRPHSRQRVVELFGELIGFVLRTLPLAPGLEVEVVVGDAREAIRENAASDVGRWDVVVLDVFAGSVVPLHVSTVEFYTMLEGCLAADGVLLVNTLTSHGFDFTRTALVTLSSVFSHVIAVAAPAVMHGERAGNIVLAASDRPLDLSRLAANAALWPRAAHVYDEWELLPFAGGGTVNHDVPAVLDEVG